MAKTLYTSVVLALTTVVGSTANADPIKFRAIPLGVPGTATAISESGAVTVTVLNSPTGVPDGGYLVKDGRIVRIPGASSAVAVNDANTVVGETVSARPYVWAGGPLISLPANRGDAAWDINNQSIVAGVKNERATIWRNGASQQITFESAFSSAHGINNHGTVVGGIDRGTNDIQAFIWSEDLGLQVLPPSTSALDVNDRGTVVGQAWNSDGREVGFLFNPLHGLSSFPLTSGAIGLTPFAVNDSDWVVGSVYVPSNDEEQIPSPHAFLSFGAGTHFFLDDLLVGGFDRFPDPFGGRGHWLLQAASGINSKGQIAATARHTLFGGEMAVRLDPVAPVPEPTTLVLFGTGAAAVGTRVWRLRRRRDE